MEFSDTKLQEFRENHKTQFLAGQFDALLHKRDETIELGKGDSSMLELASEEVKGLDEQLDSL